jgi:hypothetical protein
MLQETMLGKGASIGDAVALALKGRSNCPDEILAHSPGPKRPELPHHVLPADDAINEPTFAEARECVSCRRWRISEGFYRVPEGELVLSLGDQAVDEIELPIHCQVIIAPFDGLRQFVLCCLEHIGSPG